MQLGVGLRRSLASRAKIFHPHPLQKSSATAGRAHLQLPHLQSGPTSGLDDGRLLHPPSPKFSPRAPGHVPTRCGSSVPSSIHPSSAVVRLNTVPVASLRTVSPLRNPLAPSQFLVTFRPPRASTCPYRAFVYQTLDEPGLSASLDGHTAPAQLLLYLDAPVLPSVVPRTCP